ncbi:MAG TPA: preprotein translocase subunit SecE [Synechococcus sp. M44_DOE_062]|nr:preprotein translocase subunit SecE [Synechococcus sp. M44_DOE_062]
MVKSTPSSKTDTEQRLDPASRGHSKDSSTELKGIPGFIQETRTELGKIVWPSRRQLIGESVGVLLIVLAFASFIYLVDQLFAWIATQLFS